jgi:sugar lactone lactonase YvrE
MWLLAGCAQQAAQEPPPPPPKPPLEFLGEWGTPGDGPGQMNWPLGIASDSVGNVYIVDAGTKFIHKFDRTGRPLLSFQSPRIKEPRDIAVDRGGAIYIFDEARHSILVFSPIGDFLFSFRIKVEPSPEGVTSLAVDAEGNLYVADTFGKRIVRYNQRGRMTTAWEVRWPQEEQAVQPTGLSIGPDGIVNVSTGSAKRIARFSPEGEFLSAWADEYAGEMGVSRIAACSKGLFLLRSGPTLEVWDYEGRLQVKQEYPPKPPLFSPPPPPDFGPASAFQEVTCTGDQAYILDAGRGRVLLFRINF